MSIKKLKSAYAGLGIIIQGRIKSKRLPGKILMNIAGKTLLEHVLMRLETLRHKAKIVLATSCTSSDDVVEGFCKKKGVVCFRGSEENVLERYYLCARKFGFHNIIRLTGDNPFIDVDELDNLIDLHLTTGSDYTSSIDYLPVGVGSEIFTFKALELSYRKGKMPNHLEHVNEYVLENPHLFKTSILDVPSEKKRNDIRLTVDTEGDYVAACRIAESSDKDLISTQEAISLAERFTVGKVV
jgi:spore coat polysaccharide biosynthesis protein SpsF